MTQVAIGGLSSWPDVFPDPTATIGSGTLDNTADYLGGVFQAPKTGTINYIHWRTASVTNWSGTLRVRIVDVDPVTGGPGTTTYGDAYTTSTQASGTNYVTTPLGASVTAGQWYAVVIDCPAVASGSIAVLRGFSYYLGGAGSYYAPYSFQSTDNAGTLVKAATAPILGIEYSDGYTPMPVAPVCTTGTVSLSSSGTVKVGNIFASPFPMDAVGIWVVGDLDGDITLDIHLGDNASPIAGATCTCNKAFRGGGGFGLHQVLFDSGSIIQLAAGVTYRVVATATTTTASAIYRLLNVPENAQLDQLPGGKDWFYTSYSGGAWADTDTARGYVGLLIRRLSDGAGGGLLTHPGMDGGMCG
jgi:hypothetical protein